MDEFTQNLAGSERSIRIAGPQEDTLGPLKQLPGTWANIRPENRLNCNRFKGQGTLSGQGASPYDGFGWNLIALPFAEVGQLRNYRLMMNQYNEVLTFDTIDEKIPNRGIRLHADDPSLAENTDQRVTALNYEQLITQISSEDVGESGAAGEADLPVHHETGFFLHMREQQTSGFNTARLATLPYGSTVTALGRSWEFSGPPAIQDLTGFPEGINDNIVDSVDKASNTNSYLFPYHHFVENPFKGVLDGSSFQGFSPLNVNALLQKAIPKNVVKTTVLPLATDVLEAGITSIPFIVRQADAALMHSTFWIMELDTKDTFGRPSMVLAYSQLVYLDFFDRFDGRPGRIRWPHISINMMEKIAWPDDELNAEERLIM